MGVRNESVRLDLTGDFTTSMAKAAAATALLNRELHRLSGQSVTTTRSTQNLSRDTDAVGTSAAKADRSINQLTGRLRLFADLAAILGPGLAPISAVAVPAVAGLANQMGVAALAGGTMIAAFQGVGDALKAVEKARLEPTVQNLQAARDAMAQISPAAQDMVNRIQELRPVLRGIRDEAAEGLFPGMIEGIDALEARADDLERIFSSVATATGDLFADAGESLASAKWDDFFTFLETEAPQTLESLGRTVGDLAHGLAELWMAFDPLNDDFSGWFEGIAEGFDEWAAGLAQTQGFQEFMDYVRSTGPQVAETFGALVDAVLEIGEAAAPLGGPVLAGLEAVAKTIAAIADSDLGTPIMTAVGGMALLSRGAATFAAVSSTAWGAKARGNLQGLIAGLTTVTSAQDRARLSAAQLAAVEEKRAAATRRGLATLGKAAGLTAALAVSSTGVADEIEATNTITLGLIGTLGGPFGAAIGSGVGAVMDLKAAHDDLKDSIEAAYRAIDSGSREGMTASLKGLYDQLNDLDNINLSNLAGKLGGLFGGDVRSDKIRAAIKDIEAALDSVGKPRRGIATLLPPPDGIQRTSSLLEAAAGSADQFREALIRANNVLTGRGAMREYEAALDDFAEALKKAGDASEYLNKNKTDFDIDTGKGRELQTMFDGIASAGIEAAAGLEGLARVRFMENLGGQLRGLAREAGIPRKAARELVADLLELDGVDANPKLGVVDEASEPIGNLRKELRSYGLTRENATAALNDVASMKIRSVQGLIDKYGMTRAQARALLQDMASGAIDAVRGRLRSLDGDNATVTITTRHVTEIITKAAKNVGGAVPGFANGGVVDFYANGGLRENHVAQIAPAGSWRVWAEPETGGEAYIPLAPAKRERSRDIAREVVSRLGGEVAWFANGALMDRPVRSSAAGHSSSVSRPAGLMVLTGTLDTPFGPAQVRGVVREEIKQRDEQRVRDTFAGMRG